MMKGSDARAAEVEYVLSEAGALTDAAFSYAATLERVPRLTLPAATDAAFAGRDLFV